MARQSAAAPSALALGPRPGRLQPGCVRYRLGMPRAVVCGPRPTRGQEATQHVMSAWNHPSRRPPENSPGSRICHGRTPLGDPDLSAKYIPKSTRERRVGLQSPWYTTAICDILPPAEEPAIMSLSRREVFRAASAGLVAMIAR